MSEVLKDIRNNTAVATQYRSLLRICRKDFSDDEMAMLRKSFSVALEASLNNSEKLGKMTIFHALGVATILAKEIGVGAQSVIAAILFDYYLDQAVSTDTLRQFLPARIISIIEGVAKISRVDTQKSSNHAENLRNLILTMSSDIRVILVKLADRLYFMRELNHLGHEEQLRIALETFNIYAPIAHRMGLYALKSELEDLYLKHTDKESYRAVQSRLQETKASREKFIRDFIKPIKLELEKENLIFEITGRTKSIYSIWRKMRQQEVDFEEVYDLFAIRIILKSEIKSEKSDCWNVYSMITGHYQPNPNRLRDWISVPKSNGYESLHTTVVVPGGRWVEVQIRTHRMDEVAEKGLAAHWKYKGGRDEGELEGWLSKVREILENPEPDADEFIDDFKLSLYNKEIFVFTPKGDLKKFPLGATSLDFAYDIHSEVGGQCVGAKVNGRAVPIRYKLNNGDKVEILTSNSQKPKQDWLNFVVTPRARNKIKQALAELRLKEADHGREILRRRFRNWKVEFEDNNINKLLRKYKLKTASDLYYSVATEKIDLLEIKDLLQDKEAKTEQKTVEKIEDRMVDKIISSSVKRDDFLIIEKDLDKVDYKLGRCCNPIFGDEIFGFVTVTSGITIHRINCPNATQLISKYGYRVVRAQWAETGSDVFLPVSLKVVGIDDIGILSRISDVISKDLRVNMRSVSVDSTDGMFEGSITLFVKDTGHLDTLISRLKKIRGVLKVSRLDTYES